MTGQRLVRALAGAFLLAFFAATYSVKAQSSLSDYRLSGVTVYAADHILAFAYQHVAQSDGQVTPNRLAEAIDLIYREDGYMLAETEIVYRDDGGIDFVVHEGVISAVDISGVDEGLFGAIRGYVEPLIGKSPLRQKDFERAIMLASDLSGLSVTTEITYPPDTEGALLTVHGEARRQTGVLSIDNPPRDLGEAISLYGSQEIYSLLAPGDMFRMNGGVTWHFDGGEGYSISGSAHYRTPIGPSGLYGEAFVGNVVGRRNASGLLVDTDLRGFEGGAALGFPILRDIHNYAYAVAEYRHSEAESSGGGIDFRSGVDVISGLFLFGHDDRHGAPTRIGAIVSSGWRSNAVPAGTDDGDDQFWHLRAAAATSQPLYFLHPDLSLRLDLHGQLTSSRLPSVEEFYLGSRNNLRGYRFAEASGDSGLSATTELNYIHDVQRSGLSRVNTFAFLDFGHVRNNAPGPGEISGITLVSAGLGAQANFEHGFSVRGWVGVPLVDGVTTGRHEPAVYLRLSKGW